MVLLFMLCTAVLAIIVIASAFIIFKKIEKVSNAFIMKIDASELRCKEQNSVLISLINPIYSELSAISNRSHEDSEHCQTKINEIQSNINIIAQKIEMTLKSMTIELQNNAKEQKSKFSDVLKTIDAVSSKHFNETENIKITINRLQEENKEQSTKIRTSQTSIINDIKNNHEQCLKITNSLLPIHENIENNRIISTETLSGLDTMLSIVNILCSSLNLSGLDKIASFSEGNVTKNFIPQKLENIIDSSTGTEIKFAYNDDKTIMSETFVQGVLRQKAVFSEFNTPIEGWGFNDRGKMTAHYSYDKNGQVSKSVT